MREREIREYGQVTQALAVLWRTSVFPVKEMARALWYSRTQNFSNFNMHLHHLKGTWERRFWFSRIEVGSEILQFLQAPWLYSPIGARTSRWGTKVFSPRTYDELYPANFPRSELELSPHRQLQPCRIPWSPPVMDAEPADLAKPHQDSGPTDPMK